MKLTMAIMKRLKLWQLWFNVQIEDLDNLTDVERPVLVLKWVGEGKEEERVETEERLRTKKG